MGGRVKTAAVCGSIWFIIIGTIYLALSVMAYMKYYCNMSVGENVILEVFTTVYFYNPECETKFDISDQGDVQIFIELNPPSSERTLTFSIVYIVFSSLWIATSLLLLISAFCKCAGCGLFWVMFPWVLVSIGNLLTDLFGVSIYGSDINQTLTFRNLLEFLKVNITGVYTGQIPEDAPDFDLEKIINDAVEMAKDTDVPYTWAPSAVMIFICGRAGIIWLINLILVIVIIVEAARYKKVAPIMLQNWPQTNYNKPIEYQNNQLARTQFGGEQNNTSPYISTIPVTVETLNNRQDQFNNSKDDDVFQQRASPEDNWLARKNHYNNEGDLQEKSSNLKKEFEERLKSSSGGNMVNNEELRSQLPWSYTQDRSEQLRKPDFRSSYLEDAPPVPVPDYTLHFPKRKKEDVDRVNLRSVTPPDSTTSFNSNYNNGNNRKSNDFGYTGY